MDSTSPIGPTRRLDAAGAARLVSRRFRRSAGGHSKADALDNDDLGADLDAVVEVLDVLVAHADAAGGHILTDGPGLVGAVNAVECRAEIHRARAERIADTASHEMRNAGLPRDHLRRRRPIRPLFLRGDGLHPRPGKTGAADADAVAQRLAAVLDQKQKFVRR